MSKEAKDYVAGHRLRMRARYLAEGMDSFEAYNVLEMLLFYACPRIDTKPLAHGLIERFGSISAVFEAPYEELLRVEGVGEYSAILIKMIPDIFRYYSNDKVKNMKFLHTTEEVGEFLLPKYIGRTNEMVYIICLDNKNRILACESVAEGDFTSTDINIRQIIETSLRVGATGIIISHNHPKGLAIPSMQDLKATKALQETLKTFSIRLIDHLIFDESDFTSMAGSGMI